MKDALGAVQSVLVLGGASEIGVAIASQLAGPRQAAVVLAGRRPQSLEEAAAAVRAAGASRVEILEFDADDTASHAAVLDKAWSLVGDIDVVVVAFGVLGDQAAASDDESVAVAMAQTNFVGAMSASLVAARHLRAQGHGTLVVLSSVAGERVRSANFVYGATKAGIDGFAQGLGDSLAGTGVHVLIVRPGFVHTRMTEGMKAAPLSTTADAVAQATVAGIARGRAIVWAPAPLRIVFSLLRHLPRGVWRRLPLG